VREGRKRPEGEGWLTTKQTANMLHRAVQTIHWMVAHKQLTRYRYSGRLFFRIEEVEALARRPDRLRRESNRERRLIHRKMAPLNQVPEDLMDLEAAAWMLGVSQGIVKHLVYTGQLTSYQQILRRSPHRFSAAEVEALRKTRAARKAERKARPRPETKLPRWTGRRRLPRGGRVEVGDLRSGRSSSASG
jgi:hypothetical protein